MDNDVCLCAGMDSDVCFCAGVPVMLSVAAPPHLQGTRTILHICSKERTHLFPFNESSAHISQETVAECVMFKDPFLHTVAMLLPT